MNQNRQLAIIVPIYKIDFLEETINSILNQTNKNFNLYLCLDGPNEQIKCFLSKIQKDDRINIYLFPVNLGMIDLVGQWRRCIELSKEESYIWLFPDDDIMSSNCVDLFYEKLKINYGVPVITFSTQFIDDNGMQISETQIVPDEESAQEYLISRLKSQRWSSLADHIFLKSSYMECNGFPELNLGWFSDDIAWINFANGENIIGINDAIIFVRMSNLNISNNKNYAFSIRKIESLYNFLEFSVEKLCKNDKLHSKMHFVETFYYNHLRYLNVFLSLKDIYRYCRLNSELFAISKMRSFYRLLLHNLRVLKTSK